MSYNRTAPAGLIPVGFQKMTLADSTAIGLNGTVRPCSVVDISVETNPVRFRADGTDPTLTTGVLLAAGYYRFEGFNNTASLKFQRSTGSATVSVQSYRRVGENTL